MAITAGITAARALPSSSSQVRTGVASSGSRLRACFSPMTLNVAMVIGAMTGVSSSMNMNWPTRTI